MEEKITITKEQLVTYQEWAARTALTMQSPPPSVEEIHAIGAKVKAYYSEQWAKNSPETANLN